MRFLSIGIATFTTITTIAGIAGIAGCANTVHDGHAGPRVAVNPSASAAEALSMPACGTVLASFDGTDAYSNGADTGSGWSCNGEGSFGYRYQCVELVMRHFKNHWGLRWYGNARDLLDDAPGADVDVYDNGDGAHPPVPGDMVVWKNGQYGHVALVTAVHTASIDVLEQNVGGPGTASLPWDGATIGARWGTWVPAGWAHAKANHAATPPPPPAPGIAWSCGQSAYEGGQYWTCHDGDAFKCEGGVPHKIDCEAGCYTRSPGENDVCIENGTTWQCSDSAYDGAQFWTCSGSSLHKCQNGAPIRVDCPQGCHAKPLGTDDACY